MPYVEIAVSDGPGTLICHMVSGIHKTMDSDAKKAIERGCYFMAQTLTESEAMEWKEIHGGWVAV